MSSVVAEVRSRSTPTSMPRKILALGRGQSCLRSRVAVLAQVPRTGHVGGERQHAERLPGEAGRIPPHVVEGQRRRHRRIDGALDRRNVRVEIGLVARQPAAQPHARRQERIRRRLEAVAEIALPHPGGEAVDQAVQVDRCSPAGDGDAVVEGRVVVVRRRPGEFRLPSPAHVGAGERQRVGEDAHQRTPAASRAPYQQADAAGIGVRLAQARQGVRDDVAAREQLRVHLRCGVGQVDGNEQAHRRRQEAIDADVP